MTTDPVDIHKFSGCIATFRVIELIGILRNKDGNVNDGGSEK